MGGWFFSREGRVPVPTQRGRRGRVLFPTGQGPRPTAKDGANERKEMRRTLLLVAMAGAMLLAFSGVVLAQQSGFDSTAPGGGGHRATAEEGAGQAVPGRYIVVLKSDANARKVAEE